MTIYEDLGVRGFINAYAPLTRLGGAALPHCVVQAMTEASRRCVVLADLQRKAGDAIARLTGNEAAYITSGASAGLTLCVAACMAGENAGMAECLPDATGMVSRVLMQACDRGTKCDNAIRCSGARIETFGGAYGADVVELAAALAEPAAAVIVVASSDPRQISLERIVAVSRARGVPVLVDAAGAVPPKKNFWTFTREFGADAVVISGGKGLRGPQTSGIILGTKRIIEGCRFHGVPNTRIGRGMKVGKEEIAGLYAAVKRMIDQDENLELANRMRQASFIARALHDLGCAEVRRPFATRLEISFDCSAIGLTYAAAVQWLRRNEPAIYVDHSERGIILDTSLLDEGDEIVIAEQLRRFLAKHFKGISVSYSPERTAI
jgi:uncharacterized pyridoxal phosphate-dependent enzyme